MPANPSCQRGNHLITCRAYFGDIAIGWFRGQGGGVICQFSRAQCRAIDKAEIITAQPDKPVMPATVCRIATPDALRHRQRVKKFVGDAKKRHLRQARDIVMPFDLWRARCIGRCAICRNHRRLRPA